MNSSLVCRAIDVAVAQMNYQVTLDIWLLFGAQDCSPALLKKCETPYPSFGTACSASTIDLERRIPPVQRNQLRFA